MMTPEARIQALDAALCAVEGTEVPSDLRNALQDWIETYYDRTYPGWDKAGWADHAVRMQDAVVDLSENPASFGG